MKSSVRFKDIAQNYGQVFIQHYHRTVKVGTDIQEDGQIKLPQCLVFFPIPPIDNAMRCSNCGRAEWNASNFGNTVHFCPDREIEIEHTEFRAQGISTDSKRILPS